MIKDRLKQNAASVFSIAQEVRGKLYVSGRLPRHEFEDCVILSVGNIAVGGRGKSPLALYIASHVAARGYNTTLLLRGYKGKMEYTGGLVSSGHKPLVSAQMAGDEAFQAAQMCPGVSVRVGANRVRQVREAVAEGCRVIVLDDGFQHRKLKRDVDIVCVSPKDLSSTARFFPVGELRESARSLGRAHLRAGYAAEWAHQKNAPPVLFTLVPTGLFDTSFQRFELSQLPAKVHLLSAIGTPQRFEQTVLGLDIPNDQSFHSFPPPQIVAHTIFPDHHVFSNTELAAVCVQAQTNGTQAIVTTTKDLARLDAYAGDIPLFGLGTQLVVVKGKTVLHETITQALVKR